MLSFIKPAYSIDSSFFIYESFPLISNGQIEIPSSIITAGERIIKPGKVEGGLDLKA